ncbi:uncharacterized protein LOC132305548 [Cornus florida]|uniref:uncharacterized protein LOC132305548 n=1 Tax=Cornus florida TaxID=4283 RepID=UPI0028983035|nr:uncharacterized protein LOC132305548 [Cornus florida]
MEGQCSENESARLGGEEAVEEDDEMLKKRISGHPLYGLLIEAHLNCLKEGYCMALGKLKEAMEKPLQETTAYIDAMHARLSELSVIPPPLSPPQ